MFCYRNYWINAKFWRLSSSIICRIRQQSSNKILIARPFTILRGNRENETLIRAHPYFEGAGGPIFISLIKKENLTSIQLHYASYESSILISKLSLMELTHISHYYELLAVPTRYSDAIKFEVDSFVGMYWSTSVLLYRSVIPIATNYLCSLTIL